MAAHPGYGAFISIGKSLGFHPRKESSILSRATERELCRGRIEADRRWLLTTRGNPALVRIQPSTLEVPSSSGLGRLPVTELTRVRVSLVPLVGMYAKVVELADTLVLGTSAARHEGSSPSFRTVGMD